ncbi:MAG TPA: hypothetical protein PKC39_10715 [Ferruginibacter sp.]|nr:hypothetical protein [Ferruginibacter sp.]HMP21420.1 hypothetical protein [Ferruginibacter sp.]
MNFIYTNIICTVLFFILSAQLLQHSSFSSFFAGHAVQKNVSKQLSKPCFFKTAGVQYNTNCETIDRDLDYDIPDLPTNNNAQEEKCKDESATKVCAYHHEQCIVVYNSRLNLFNEIINSQFSPMLVLPPPRQ